MLIIMLIEDTILDFVQCVNNIFKFEKNKYQTAQHINSGQKKIRP